MDTRSKLLAKYGLTKETYQEKLDKQGGRCYICREEPKKDKAGHFRNLAVDHNHSTGTTRGLLDFKCNKILVSKIDRMYSKNALEVAQNLARYVAEFDFVKLPKEVKDAKPKRKRITKRSRTTKSNPS